MGHSSFDVHHRVVADDVSVSSESHYVMVCIA
jgi:hypothetical protein